MRPYRSNRICIEPGFFIQVAIALMVLPVNWVVAWFLAAVFHELCHYFALRFYCINVYIIRVSLTGTVIEAEPMRLKHDLISSAAGPFGSILLVSLLRIFPEIAICALMQAVFNLLPVFPFDGGRALVAILAFFRGREQAESILRYVQVFVFSCMLGLSVLFSYSWGFGLLPTGICLLLLIRSVLIKTPCKQRQQIVQ